MKIRQILFIKAQKLYISLIYDHAIYAEDILKRNEKTYKQISLSLHLLEGDRLFIQQCPILV